MVVPTLQARVQERIYVHASSASRVAMQTMPLPVCLTTAIVDGIVLARSGFNHSINYRSTVVVGEAKLVEDEDERLLALRAITDALVPGRWDELRPPTRKELRATAVLRLGLDEASAKVRRGGPVDEAEDVDPTVWAGVLPIRTVADRPIPARDVSTDVPPPASVKRARKRLDAIAPEGAHGLGR